MLCFIPTSIEEAGRIGFANFKQQRHERSKPSPMVKCIYTMAAGLPSGPPAGRPRGADAADGLDGGPRPPHHGHRARLVCHCPRRPSPRRLTASLPSPRVPANCSPRCHRRPPFVYGFPPAGRFPSAPTDPSSHRTAPFPVYRALPAEPGAPLSPLPPLPRRPVWGVQFHPESAASLEGDLLFRNFLRSPLPADAV